MQDFLVPLRGTANAEQSSGGVLQPFYPEIRRALPRPAPAAAPAKGGGPEGGSPCRFLAGGLSCLPTPAMRGKYTRARAARPSGVEESARF